MRSTGLGSDKYQLLLFIGLTQPWLKPAGSGFEPARFRFPDLSPWEADALLIQPPRLGVVGGGGGGGGKQATAASQRDATERLTTLHCTKRTSNGKLSSAISLAMRQVAAPVPGSSKSVHAEFNNSVQWNSDKHARENSYKTKTNNKITFKYIPN